MHIWRTKTFVPDMSILQQISGSESFTRWLVARVVGQVHKRSGKLFAPHRLSVQKSLNNFYYAE